MVFWKKSKSKHKSFEDQVNEILFHNQPIITFTLKEKAASNTAAAFVNKECSILSSIVFYEDQLHHLTQEIIDDIKDIVLLDHLGNQKTLKKMANSFEYKWGMSILNEKGVPYHQSLFFYPKLDHQ